MRDLKTLIPYMMRYWPRLLVGAVAITITVALTLTMPYLLGSAVDMIKAGQPQSDIGGVVVQIVVLAALLSVGDFFARYLINYAARKVEYDLRNDLFAHFQEMHQGFFQDNHTGDLMARATNDMSAVRMFLGPGVNNSLRTGLMFIVAAALMLGINLKLALILIVFMPLVSIAFVIIGGRMNERYEHVQSQFGNLSTYAQENFSGIRVIKAYAQEKYEIEHFARANQGYLQRSMAYQRLSQLLWPMMSLVLGLAAAAVLWVGGNEVIAGNITLGQFVQFNGYLWMLSWPMIALGWVVSLYQQGAASMRRIRQLLIQQPALRQVDTLESSNVRTLAPSNQRSNLRTFEPSNVPEGDIVFDHVSLSYGKHEVLDDVSFHAPAGSTLAIVGATGAGKTSIVNLITRVHDVQAGRVLIDGVDVREVPLAELRRNIGYVPQDTFLFSTSLEENVAFGVEEPEPAMIARSAEVSRLSKDLDQFPDGLKTVIGERGVTLSGGQKQRTSLARAVMRDPAILILDDALSSIDTHTQSEILAGLQDVLRGRTSIIISQRISTVKAADQILVLENGHIIERGTHAELVANRGLYARMYRRELLTHELGVDPLDA